MELAHEADAESAAYTHTGTEKYANSVATRTTTVDPVTVTAQNHKGDARIQSSSPGNSSGSYCMHKQWDQQLASAVI